MHNLSQEDPAGYNTEYPFLMYRSLPLKRQPSLLSVCAAFFTTWQTKTCIKDHMTISQGQILCAGYRTGGPSDPQQGRRAELSNTMHGKHEKI